MEKEITGYTNDLFLAITPGLIVGLSVALLLILLGVMLYFKRRSEVKKQAERISTVKQELEETIKNV